MTTRSTEADLYWEAAEIVADLLDLEPTDRNGRLEDLTSGRESLRSLARSMLDQAPAVDSLFEGPDPDEEADAWIGRKIGHYEIRGLLDEGGMGQVFSAARVDDFRSSVALKIIRPDRISPLDIQRFENERQILAELEHPNIARLIDGGEQDSIPYIVMELVDGVPIDQYCDSHSLSTRSRIRVFSKVCSAVAALHAKLIVHRDLKPSNILVDSEGVPKLLDFGISKPLELSPLFHLELTKEHRAPLTLLYASPEQLSGDRIQPASDVYSLGVLLYRLLVGRVPYGVDLSHPDEVYAAVRHAEVVRPSTMALRADVSSASPRELRGDLDCILLGCLQEDPNRRIDSVEQLMAELQRYLRGEPVKSRHGGNAYRAQKYLQRHKVELSVFVLILFLLATAASGWWQARNHLEQVESEQERFAEIAVFLEDIFKDSAPDLGGTNLLARDLLDRAKGRLQSGIERSPEVRADLSSTLADVYRQAGALTEARELFGEAVGLWRQSSGDRDHPRLERDLHNLASIELDLGNLPTAEVLFREALAMGRRSNRSPAELVTTINSLAAIHYRRGHLEEAEELYREGLGIRRDVFGPDSEAAAHNLYSLGVILFDLERAEEAEDLLRTSLNIRRARLGSKNTLTASSASSLGRVLHALDRLEEAESYLNKALETRAALLPEDHLHLAISRIDLALLRIDGGFLPQATSLLDLAEPAVQSPDTKPEYRARAQLARGALYLAEGKRSEGIRLLESAHAILEAERGLRSAYTRNVARRLASEGD